MFLYEINLFHILTSFQLHTSIQWYANMKKVVIRDSVFMDRKNSPQCQQIHLLKTKVININHPGNLQRKKTCTKYQYLKSSSANPQDVFTWLCQIYNYNFTQVRKQVTVGVLFYVADCFLHNNLSKLSYYFRTHLQPRLCERWSIYTKKICFNKQIQYLYNKYCKTQCKMGYLSNEENGIKWIMLPWILYQ